MAEVSLGGAALFVLAGELREALDAPDRDGYPWEHLGDAEKDVRVLLAALDGLARQLDQAERECAIATRAWNAMFSALREIAEHGWPYESEGLREIARKALA